MANLEAPGRAQLTWISDAVLVPGCLFELTFGALGALRPGRSYQEVAV
jgi:hypothetical protein